MHRGCKVEETKSRDGAPDYDSICTWAIAVGRPGWGPAEYDPISHALLVLSTRLHQSAVHGHSRVDGSTDAML